MHELYYLVGSCNYSTYYVNKPGVLTKKLIFFQFLNLSQQDTEGEYQSSFDNQYFPRPRDFVKLL